MTTTIDGTGLLPNRGEKVVDTLWRQDAFQHDGRRLLDSGVILTLFLLHHDAMMMMNQRTDKIVDISNG